MKYCFLLLLLLLTAGAAALELKPSVDTAVFAPGESVVFSVSEPAGEFKVTDFDRKVLRNGRFENGTITLSELPLGYYELNAGDARYPFAVIPKFDRNKTDWHKNQFGAMVAPHTRYPLEHRDFDAKFMERIGMRYVRTHRLNWIQIQPAENRPPDWSAADREVEIYHNRGLSIVATTAWPFPAWASSGRGTKTNAYYLDKMFPADRYIEQTRAFHAELAKRYRGKVVYWEIGNEVDAENFWVGRYKHQGDKEAIMQDFIEFYAMIAKALRQGDPKAVIGPNTTGRAPDGYTYRNWLDVFLANPDARNEMDYFSTHYSADLAEVRKVLSKYEKEGVDIILTEIGGMVSTPRNDAPWDDICRNIRISYIQYATQLTAGGKALCKFLLRDIPELKNPGWIAGMLEGDFKLRPEYVAMGTMIRLIGDADPAGRLNITNHTEQGWLHGFRFKRGNRNILLVILNDAKKSKVTLRTPEKEIKVTDVMGRESILTAKDGKISFDMNPAHPLFLEGVILGDPGEGKDPEPKLLKEIKIECNGNFEMPVRGKTIPYWHLGYDTGKGSPEEAGFLVTVDDEMRHSGRQSLKIHAAQRTGWYAVCHTFQTPKPQLGQYMEITYSWHAKGSNIDSIDKAGFAPSLSLRRKDNSRIRWKDAAYERDSFDWHRGEEKHQFEREDIPPDLNHFSLEFYLGRSTGTVWLDDVNITVRIYQRGAAEARYIN